MESKIVDDAKDLLNDDEFAKRLDDQLRWVITDLALFWAKLGFWIPGKVRKPRQGAGDKFPRLKSRWKRQ